MSAAIEFRGVSKRFTLSHNRPRSLQEVLIRAFSLSRKRLPEDDFWALKDLSFVIHPQQTVGLIGTNGSGKSTALKLMAGILQPTRGEIHVNGRVSALLELGAGMHPELTGRENVFLNGSLLGLSNAEMERLYPAIVDFSEIERFIDMPVKHYSSGMYMRLGFSVAVHVRPDILLLDEVLAVGDQGFQTKCLERIYEMKKQGTTIVMVGHNLETMQSLCDELIWLDDGVLREQGSRGHVVTSYLYDVHSSKRDAIRGGDTPGSIRTVPEEKRWGTREVEIVAVRLRNGEGEVTEDFLTGDGFVVEIEYVAHEEICDPMFGLAIHHVDGTHVNGPNNKFAGIDIGSIKGKGTVYYRVSDLPLLPAVYDLSVSAYDSQGIHPYDVHWRAYTFHVDAGGTGEKYGIVRMPGEWAHEACLQEHVPSPVAATQNVPRGAFR